MSPAELERKVQEYMKFKDSVLLKDLKALEDKRDQLSEDLKQLKELEVNVAELVKVRTHVAARNCCCFAHQGG